MTKRDTGKKKTVWLYLLFEFDVNEGVPFTRRSSLREGRGRRRVGKKTAAGPGAGMGLAGREEGGAAGF